MFNYDYSQWSAKDGFAANSLFEPLAKLQHINSETYDQAAREWTSFMTDTMAIMMKGIQILPGVKSPEDFSNIQMKLISDQMKNFIEFTDHMAVVYQTALKHQQEWMQESGPLSLKTMSASVSKTKK